MDNVCPICNKINEIKFNCVKCGNLMVEKGRKQEYYDDYSADDPIKDYDEYCMHLFKCTKCEYMEDVKIRKIII